METTNHTTNLAKLNENKEMLRFAKVLTTFANVCLTFGKDFNEYTEDVHKILDNVIALNNKILSNFQNNQEGE